MGCYRCGTRQTDPARGPSPWRRGVRRGRQVLVCPDCQRHAEWSADLDACPRCGSVALAVALGAVRCRDCGAEAAAYDEGVTPPDPALAAEVAEALARAFGRDRPPPPG